MQIAAIEAAIIRMSRPLVICSSRTRWKKPNEKYHEVLMDLSGVEAAPLLLPLDVLMNIS